MKNSTTIGNVCFIFNEDKSKVLLLKRSNEPMKNLWTGVGGKTNFTEDIYKSALREIREETGLEVSDLQLKGVLKTLLYEKGSSWILFIYSCVVSINDDNRLFSNEGTLKWIETSKVYNYNLIGFIREILPQVISSDKLFEHTLIHDSAGNVIAEDQYTW